MSAGNSEIRAELENANLTVHQQVNAIFAGTQSLVAAAEPIRNVIQSVSKSHSPLEEALAGTYYRMSLMMESLVSLNHPKHFQVALQITRCLYESYIDVAELVAWPRLLPQFEAYIFVAKFTAAEKLVNEIAAQGILDPEINKLERTFISDPTRRSKFDTERATYWTHSGGGIPRTPSNWRDMTLPDRAKALGNEEILRYRRLYSFLCWFSHAGLVGISHVSRDGLESAMGMAHGHSQDFYFAATTLIATQFDVYRANPDLRETVDKFKEATAKVLLSYLRQLESSEHAVSDGSS